MIYFIEIDIKKYLHHSGQQQYQSSCLQASTLSYKMIQCKNCKFNILSYKIVSYHFAPSNSSKESQYVCTHVPCYSKRNLYQKECISQQRWKTQCKPYNKYPSIKTSMYRCYTFKVQQLPCKICKHTTSRIIPT